MITPQLAHGVITQLFARNVITSQSARDLIAPQFVDSVVRKSGKGVFPRRPTLCNTPANREQTKATVEGSFLRYVGFSFSEPLGRVTAQTLVDMKPFYFWGVHYSIRTAKGLFVPLRRHSVFE